MLVILVLIMTHYNGAHDLKIRGGMLMTGRGAGCASFVAFFMLTIVMDWLGIESGSTLYNICLVIGGLILFGGWMFWVCCPRCQHCGHPVVYGHGVCRQCGRER